jgi:uncharacterized lipoprotein YmbA
LTVQADGTLEVNISRFEVEPAGPVRLTAQWIFRPEGKKSRLRSEDIRVDGSPNGPTDLVSAMSDALGQLSDRIASTVVE